MDFQSRERPLAIERERISIEAGEEEAAVGMAAARPAMVIHPPCDMAPAEGPRPGRLGPDVAGTRARCEAYDPDAGELK